MSLHDRRQRGRTLFAAVFPALFALVLSLSPPFPAWGAGAVRSRLISETEATAAGLTRPWFNQVAMNPSHDRITQISLLDDTLFITSDNGWLHVIDTKTGNTLWSRRVGSERFYSLPPAANSYAAVVLHGSTVHVFDRFDGKKLLEFDISGPAGGGPQVSERYIYVPILTGKIFAYPLRRYDVYKDPLDAALESVQQEEDQDAATLQERAQKIRKAIELIATDKRVEKKGLIPFDDKDVQVCPALGEPLVQPFLCTQDSDHDYFSWVTTSGSLMIGGLDMKKSQNALKLLYSISLAPQSMYIDLNHYKEVDLDFGNDINARPTFIQKDNTDVNAARGGEARGGLILMGARSGYVFAVNDELGTAEWTFPVGMAVIDPIGVAGDQCFIPTYTGHFFCLNLKSGKALWSIRDIKQFVSASPSRLYALDMIGNLLVINRDNGQTIHTIPLSTGMGAVFNIESDRIFLVGQDGLVQCLHESQLDEPLRYQKSSFDIAEEFQKRIDEAYSDSQDGKKAEERSDEATDEEIFGDEEEGEDDEIFGSRRSSRSEKDERAAETDDEEGADEEADDSVPETGSRGRPRGNVNRVIDALPTVVEGVRETTGRGRADKNEKEDPYSTDYDDTFDDEGDNADNSGGDNADENAEGESGDTDENSDDAQWDDAGDEDPFQ